MSLTSKSMLKRVLIAALLCLVLVYAARNWIPRIWEGDAGGQGTTAPSGEGAAPEDGGGAGAGDVSPDEAKQDAPPDGADAGTPGGVPASPPEDAAAKTKDETIPATEEIQLSFQGAEINVVVQWLAKTTGKSVVKHPAVKCKLTIVSSKSLPVRQALMLVYDALSLEGFAVVETRHSVYIVPEGKEPKISPELIETAEGEIPEGRQLLVKMFPLEHVRPDELKDKIQGLLSERGSIEIDDRAGQIMVRDYTENIRLLDELIAELDVSSVTDTVIEIRPLKHAEADLMAKLLSTIVNARSARPAPRGEAGSGSESPGGPPQPPKGGGSSGIGPSVHIWPDSIANRLIIVAPGSELSEIRELIDLLDVERPRDVAVRIIPLNHVGAAGLVQEIAPLYKKLSGNSIKDMIEVSANERSNSLIVLSSEANFNAIQTLVSSLDTEDAQERLMRAFQLVHADAEDVAEQLQELSQGKQPQRPYYYFRPQRDSQANNMRVVADRRRNTVIVQAPPSLMQGIEEMVKILDEPVTVDSLAPKIFPLKFVSAVDIEDVLNELLLKKEQQRSYWDYSSRFSETTDRDVGKLYGKVRITSEPYSNSIIVTSDSKEYLSAVEAILDQLDVPSDAGESTLRVSLTYADAATVATSVNVLFARPGSPPLQSPAQQAPSPNSRNPQAQGAASESRFELDKEQQKRAYYPWLGPQQDNLRGADRGSTRPVSDLIGRVRVVPDNRSNALLVTSKVHFFPQILKLIDEMDAPSPQVLIEAKIVEVSSDFRDKLGVRWSPDGTQIFEEDDMDQSILASTSGIYSNLFLGSKMADSLRIGILDASIDLDFLVQVLRKNTDARILAEPQINIADNEIGKLFVGAQVPFIITSVFTTQDSRNDSFEYKNVGIVLEVTPQISNDRDLAMQIRVESSNIRSGETLFGGAILDTRKFQSDLMARTGQTIILGGIIQSEIAEVIRKIPLLGSIPVLGWAFKKKDSVSRNVELMVFLRPTITRSPMDVEALMQGVEERIPKIMDWKEDLESAREGEEQTETAAP
jgi:type II secretion system protein D